MPLYDRLTQDQRIYLEKLLNKTEASVLDTYRAALVELKAEMLDLATRYGQKGILTASEMNRFNRYSSMMNSLRGKIAQAVGKAQETMKKSVAEMYLETRARTSYAMDMAAGVPLGFGRIDEKDLEKAVNDKYSKLADSKALELDRGAAFSRVKNEINLSMARGEDVGATARRVGAVLGFRDQDGVITPNGKGELYKAMRIARTETHRVQSQGQTDAFVEAQALGVDCEKVWDAALDDRTRDTHGEMDGRVADEDGLFTLPGGETTLGPGQSGIAEEDINCRCVARIQVKGFPPSVRRVGDGVEPWQSYKEWKDGLEGGPGGVNITPNPSENKAPEVTLETFKTGNQELDSRVGDDFSGGDDFVKMAGLDALQSVSGFRVSNGVSDYGGTPSAYFMPRNGSLNFHPKILASHPGVAAHEIGHAHDFFIAMNDAKNAGGSFELKALVDEFQDKYIGKSGSLKKAGIELKAELWKDKDIASIPGLSDTICSITKQKIVGMFGHSKAYYDQTPDGYLARAEVYANIFQLLAEKNTKAISFLDKYFPGLVGQVERIIKRV